MQYGCFEDISGLGSDDTGKVITPTLASAWIAPAGTFYYVRSCNHYGVANDVFDTVPEALEAKGYIHLSLAYSDPKAIINTGERAKITQAQADTIFDMWSSIPDDMQDKEMFRSVVEHSMTLVR